MMRSLSKYVALFIPLIWYYLYDAILQIKYYQMKHTSLLMTYNYFILVMRGYKVRFNFNDQSLINKLRRIWPRAFKALMLLIIINIKRNLKVVFYVCVSLCVQLFSANNSYLRLFISIFLTIPKMFTLFK